ncbi:YppF family protein [Aureibacillus halotolerans]|uniref:YppF-like protein n=1 Tax=Aureibacillus halotolerans TaxID=1508390 RepID=A0A4V3D5L1_9BACI|nr:YppF family protein [Aureibacillus halotolerans]TDQ40467.1 YppF-like protein [Aureibacillus halotolerans]
MHLESFINHYILIKKQKPANVNDLLDYATACYIDEELSPREYRCLLNDLDKKGSKKPDYIVGDVYTPVHMLS